MVRLVAALSVTGLAGCGGGGGGNNTQSSMPVVVTFDWSGRSRDVTAPSSALSAVVTIPGSKSGGADFSWTVNRETAPAGYTKQYTSTEQIVPGSYAVSVKFYAQANGQGAVVGIAQAQETLAPGYTLGTLITAGTVANVSVAPDQLALIGKSTELTFTATDQHGALVAVTPGSAQFAVATGSTALQLTPGGQATGLSPGIATVTATVDGVKSPPVSVLSLSGYRITDLGVVGTNDVSQAVALNNKGQVVGNIWRANDFEHEHAFIWDKGQMRDLGVLSGDTRSQAYGINDNGVVVGNSSTGIDGRAFSWSGSGFVDLSLTIPNAIFAYGITNAGTLIGLSRPNNQPGTFGSAFLFANGQLQRIPISQVDTTTVQEFQFAAVNQGEAVVGTQFHLSDDNNQPFLFQHGQVTMLPTGTAPEGWANGLNDNNQVVGFVRQTPGTQQPALWSGTSVTELPLLSGYSNGWAQGINNKGQIVGTLTPALTNPVPGSRAVLWQSGQAVDLQRLIPITSGWTSLGEARAINTAGQIVGSGIINGHSHAFLMTPQ